ncbi:hypothetical protein BASA60_005646 [Batrachochytrium salamandrivorans]|nr:hypothetical protein BASA60_005646 [Batrachochytrium salamandrivorans]
MAPYGCFYATTGVAFTFIEGDADIIKNPTVVVTSTAKHPVIRPLFGEDYSKIQAGDELLAIDGLSFVEWFEQNKFKYGGGANEFGGQRAGLEYLTMIYGKTIVCQVKTLSISSSNPEPTPRTAILSMSLSDPEDVGTTNLAVEKAVMIVRSLLANELKDTHSVISSLIRASPTDFQKFPFSQELTSGSTTYANTLSVGVTQTIRTGRYKGKTLRMWVSRQILLFVPGGLICSPTPTTNTQYDRIAASLARTGQKNGQSISDSVGLYQSPTTAPGNGWNNLKGPWMIGNGVKYANNIESSIEAFFTAPIGTKINIGLDVALDTEPDCDFLYLSVKSSDGVEDFLTRSKSLDGTKTFNGISGRKKIVKGTIPFTTKSEKFSVSLKFTSDWAMEFTGATINSFTVSAA